MPFDGASYETVAMKMMELFNGGRRWGRYTYYDHGRYCLYGALMAVTNNVRGKKVNQINLPFGKKDQAQVALETAASNIYGDWVTNVNDDARSYKEIIPVLKRMHELEIEALAKGAAKPVPAKKRELVA